jgi:hypothetical protein
MSKKGKGKQTPSRRTTGGGQNRFRWIDEEDPADAPSPPADDTSDEPDDESVAKEQHGLPIANRRHSDTARPSQQASLGYAQDVPRKRSRHDQTPSPDSEIEPLSAAKGVVWTEEYGICHPPTHSCQRCRRFRDHIDQARREGHNDYLRASTARRSATGSADTLLMKRVAEANENVRQAKREQKEAELENARLRIQLDEARTRARSLYLEPLASSYRGRGTRGRGRGPARYFDPFHTRPSSRDPTPSPANGLDISPGEPGYNRIPDDNQEVDELFARANNPDHLDNRTAIHRVKSIISAMPPGNERSTRQREFLSRWTNPRTLRRQETRAATEATEGPSIVTPPLVGSSITAPPLQSTPAYDAPLMVQLPFWRTYPTQLPRPLQFYGDDQRINERLAETFLVIRRFRPQVGYHSDSRSRRVQWTRMVANTFAHPTEDLNALIQVMGVVPGPARDWLTDPDPRYPYDIDATNSLDVLAFFVIAGLTPEWIARLREFAIEYLAAFSLTPEHPDGLIPFYEMLNGPLPTATLAALSLNSPLYLPQPAVDNTDIAMGSAEEDGDTEAQGNGETH